MGSWKSFHHHVEEDQAIKIVLVDLPPDTQVVEGFGIHSWWRGEAVNIHQVTGRRGVGEVSGSRGVGDYAGLDRSHVAALGFTIRARGCIHVEHWHSAVSLGWVL